MADYTVTVDLSAPVSTSKFRVGQNWINNELVGNAAAITAAQGVMASCTDLVCTHLNWFGPYNPWRTNTDTATQMHWANESGEPCNIDFRIGKLVANGNAIAVTIGLTPAWMTTDDLTYNGQNEPVSQQLVAPTVANFPSIATLVTRFLNHQRNDLAPTGVNKIERMQLWNELKGFWSTSLNRYRYEDYNDPSGNPPGATALYNDCWTAVQTFNAGLGAGEMKVKMGGLYIPTPTNQGPVPKAGAANRLYLSNGAYVDTRSLDALLYWRDHAKGFDFVCLDGCNKYPQDVMAWMDVQFPGVPVQWNEFYEGIFNTDMTTYPQNLRRMSLAINLINCIKSGVTTAFLWQPEAVSNTEFSGQWCWSSTSVSGGGVATPTATLLQQIKTWFPPGTPLYNATVSPNDGLITVVASQTKCLVVNNSTGTVTVSVK